MSLQSLLMNFPVVASAEGKCDTGLCSKWHISLTISILLLRLNRYRVEPLSGRDGISNTRFSPLNPEPSLMNLAICCAQTED